MKYLILILILSTLSCGDVTIAKQVTKIERYNKKLSYYWYNYSNDRVLDTNNRYKIGDTVNLVEY